MVKFQFSKQKTKSAEKISQQVFYIMIGLAVLVFGLFFLVGYDLPFEENPDFNAPLFTDVLILLMWLFLIGGTGLAVFSMIRDYRSSKSEAVVLKGTESEFCGKTTPATILVAGVVLFEGNTGDIILKGPIV